MPGEKCVITVTGGGTLADCGVFGLDPPSGDGIVMPNRCIYSNPTCWARTLENGHCPMGMELLAGDVLVWTSDGGDQGAYNPELGIRDSDCLPVRRSTTAQVSLAHLIGNSVGREGAGSQ